MSKTFTLSEAQTLLPVLEALLQRAQAAGKRGGRAGARDAAVEPENLSVGRDACECGQAARRRAEREKAVQEATDTLAEIDEIGVQVKDLEQGLLDFPCVMEGQTVLLCWKLGEKEIGFWHTAEEGLPGASRWMRGLVRRSGNG